MVDDIIKENLQEAYNEVLKSKDIGSGDISPDMQKELDEAEERLIQAVKKWVKE